MFDMTKTIAPKTDQINFDDFIDGKAITIKITDVTGNDAVDQPVSIHFVGDNKKPYKPCLSMRRVLVHVWGKDGKGYIDKSMTLFGDSAVIFGGVKVGGIRISHMSDMTEEKTMMLTSTKARRKPYTVQPLIVKEPDSKLVAAGKAAAEKGLAAYREWKGTLPPDQLDLIRPHNKEWSYAAKAVDDEPDVPTPPSCATCKDTGMIEGQEPDLKTGELVDVKNPCPDCGGV